MNINEKNCFVVIGANGFLGANLLTALLEMGYPHIIATSLGVDDRLEDKRIHWLECDITKESQVANLVQEMDKYSACRVAYLAACHNPDIVQRQPKLAWNINIVALAHFLNSANNIQCLFYPSTDTVYGEGNREYAFKESDSLRPVNLYGKHKALAEHMVTTYGYNVVRFPFLIGPSLLRTRKHFYDTICGTILSGNSIEMFKDSYRSTLDFRQAAELLIKLMLESSKPIPNIINIAADDVLSKYDVGLMIAQKLGVDSSLIVPIGVAQSEQVFEAPRASSAVLDNTLLKQVLGLNVIHAKI